MSTPSAPASSDAVATPTVPTFESLGVPAGLARSLADRGIASPVPIQAATLPPALPAEFAGQHALARQRLLLGAHPREAALHRGIISAGGHKASVGGGGGGRHLEQFALPTHARHHGRLAILARQGVRML